MSLITDYIQIASLFPYGTCSQIYHWAECALLKGAMATYEANSVPSSSEYPIAPEKLSLTIEECLQKTPDDPDAYTESLLKELNKASSAHKFVVSVTTIGPTLDTNFDLSISSHIGGSWNKTKDGTYTHGLECKNGMRYLVTVVWISR